MIAFRRLIALFVVIFVAASLFVDALVVYEVWQLRSALADQLDTSTALARNTLTTSDQALGVLDTQLQSMAALSKSTEGAAQTTVTTIQDTHRSLQAASQLLRSDLPSTLSSVHQAVASAQSASVLVDDILGGLSLIPGFPSSYHPKVPLHVALGDVAQSLDTLPRLTRQLADDIDAADANLPTAQADVSGVATTLRQSPVDVESMRKIVVQYREEVAQLETQIDQLRATANGLMTWIAVAVTFVTIWLAIIQAVFFSLSVRWLRKHLQW